MGVKVIISIGLAAVVAASLLAANAHHRSK